MSVKMVLAAPILLLLMGARPAAGETPVPGTTLVHYGQVDEGVYKGSKPRTDADYRFLQARHVKYVLDLELLPLLNQSEHRRAKKYGIVLLTAHMNASPVSPSQETVEKTLAVLRDARVHPVYFHCALGRDRTNMVAALYKMYFEGMSEPQAIRYMDESGYKDGWVRSGLKRYVKKHPTPSPEFKRRLEEQRAREIKLR